MKSLKFLFKVTTLLCVFAQESFSFPQMIRYGHTSCLSCHVSPAGGGLVTPYGRELAADYLNMSSSKSSGVDKGGSSEEKLEAKKTAEDEEELPAGEAALASEENDVLEDFEDTSDFDFLHGLVELPDWLIAGGDLRALAISRKIDDETSTETILMQADLEFSLLLDRIGAVATLGAEKRGAEKNQNDNKTKFISRRHYLLVSPSEDVVIRAGRFFPSYGINIADHTAVTRSSLGWGIGQESYNVEFNLLRDFYEVSFSIIFGRPYRMDLGREEGLAFRTNFFFSEFSSGGFNFYLGDTATTSHSLIGLFGLFTLSDKTVLLSEVDAQTILEKVPGGDSVSGHVVYNKLSHEIIQGLHLSLTAQQSHLNNKSPSTLRNFYSAAVQIFPMAHLDFQLEYQKNTNPAVEAGKVFDAYWVQTHYYF